MNTQITLDVNIHLPSEILAVLASLAGSSLNDSTTLPKMVTPAPTAQIPITPPTFPVVAAPAMPAVPVSSIPAPNQPASLLAAPAQTTPVAAARAYAFADLQVAAAALCDAGKRNEVLGLLSEQGIPALSALPMEQYGAFATKLRALGGKI